jgi:signal transduction histidine kinase
MASRLAHTLWYLAVVPLGVAALLTVSALGFVIPNQPGVLLLAVAYCAYRGGVSIGLVGAAFFILFTVIFFSDPGHLFVLTGDNWTRAIVISVVAPAMGLMIGMLRSEADRNLAREKVVEAELTKLNAELEERVLARTTELVEARNQAEAAQSQASLSEARFRDFALAASDWFWEQDETLRFTYFSPEAFEGSSELAALHLGKTRREINTATLSESEWQEHEADLAARRPFRNLMTKRHGADGHVRYTNTGGQPYFDRNGKFLGYRGTARNVTTEVLGEIELERRVEERTKEVRALQQKLLEQERRATLDQLTATVSHELRNPLSAIRNSIYMIAHTAQINDLHLERPLDRIGRSLLRCENIIAQLVEYSQIRALQRRSVLVDKWLDEVLDEQALPEGVTLVRDLGATGQIVSCDADHLRRVIFSLIENAVQAIERGRNESPEQDASEKHPHRIWVRSRRVSDRIEIEIGDNGPGIAPDVLPRIFEPLFSTKTFGVGLGLSLVKQILDYHGGGIDVTSDAGKGARATLWLPSAAANEIAA